MRTGVVFAVAGLILLVIAVHVCDYEVKKQKTLLLSLLILLPAMRPWGTHIRAATWNRAGFIAACLYLALTVMAHHKAFERTTKFAAFQGVQVDSIAALPLPPSIFSNSFNEVSNETVSCVVDIPAR